MSRILIVDDERPLLRALGAHLQARGLRGRSRRDRRSRAVARRDERRTTRRSSISGLPGIDGIEVVHGLRGWTAIPIIVLSARHQDSQKIMALDAGADDYVTKPFSMGELLARLRAALRRAKPGDEVLPVVETPDFRIDLSTKRATDARRRGDQAHADAVAPRRDPRAQPRPAREPAPAARGGVGSELREPDQLPPPVHGAAPAQVRARPRAPALLPHRAGHGHPLPARPTLDDADDVTRSLSWRSSARLSSSTFTAGSPSTPNARSSVLALDEREHRAEREVPQRAATRGAWSFAFATVMCGVEPAARRGHRVDRHLHVGSEAVLLRGTRARAAPTVFGSQTYVPSLFFS